jgi:hypothetical protein
MALAAALAVTALAAPAARAGTVTGKVELPSAAERPALRHRGFLDRSENPLAPVRGFDPLPWIVVVLEGTPLDRPSTAQVPWDLVGESFVRPVLLVPAGAEVLIRNLSKTPRSLVAAEAGDLIAKGPLNPSGNKSFRVPDAGKTYTIGDPDAPHLAGRLVVMAGGLAVAPDESGRFEFADVPEGSYKLKIYYRDGWIDRPDDAVTVGGKGKVDVKPRIPSGFPLRK